MRREKAGCSPGHASLYGQARQGSSEHTGLPGCLNLPYKLPRARDGGKRGGKERPTCVRARATPQGTRTRVLHGGRTPQLRNALAHEGNYAATKISALMRGLLLTY